MLWLQFICFNYRKLRIKITVSKCFPYFREIPLQCFKTFTISEVLMNSVLRVETIKLGILKPPEKSIKNFCLLLSFLAVDWKKDNQSFLTKYKESASKLYKHYFTLYIIPHMHLWRMARALQARKMAWNNKNISQWW